METMRLLCIDIGNTSAHCGIFKDANLLETCDLPTPRLCAEPQLLTAHTNFPEGCEALAFCSVVPAATTALRSWLQSYFPHFPVYQLRHDTLPGGFELDYPTPAEIGGDRLASSCAAWFFYGAPVIVVSMGTATALDVITPRGYAGGIIAPGLALMADYLHEKTALLPKLDRFELETDNPWGRSTLEAMKIGAQTGYAGLVSALVERVRKGLQAKFPDAPPPHLLLTGGNAFILRGQKLPPHTEEPNLALKGLQKAFKSRFT
jgi:type III pantothenate kinase